MIRNRISLLYVQRDIRRPLVYPSSSQREGRRTSGSAHSGICLKKNIEKRDRISAIPRHGCYISLIREKERRKKQVSF